MGGDESTMTDEEDDYYSEDKDGCSSFVSLSSTSSTSTNEGNVAQAVDGNGKGGGGAAGGNLMMHDVEQQQKIINAEAKNVARKETRFVRCWRLIVLALILVAGGLASAATYWYLTTRQRQDFEASFYNSATAVGDECNVRARTLLSSAASLSKTITAHAETTQSHFPFVTVPVPLFQVAASDIVVDVRGDGGSGSGGGGGNERMLDDHRNRARHVIYFPLVPEIYRSAWEVYSVKNKDWIEESRDMVPLNGTATGGDDQYERGELKKYIFRVSNATGGWPAPVPQNSGPYGPAWQTSPPPLRVNANFDMLRLQSIASLVRAMEISRDVVVSKVERRLGKDIMFGDDDDDENEQLQQRQPRCQIAHPVYTKLNDPTSHIGGVLLVDHPLTDMLPPPPPPPSGSASSTGGGDSSSNNNNMHDDDGGILVVVMRNTCNQSFSYTINKQGNEAQYVGPGDDHDARYDPMMVHIPLGTMNHHLGESSSTAARNNNNLHKNASSCQYYLQVYPSSTMQEDYVTNLPLIATCIVGGTFLVVAIAFCVYDSYVRRRNQKITWALAKSNAVVSSLFPSGFRDRVFGAAQRHRSTRSSTSGGAGGGGGAGAPAKQRLKSFLEGAAANAGRSALLGPVLMMQQKDKQNGKDKDDNDSDEEVESKPIAELFAEATILFADIVGFTAWSSSREPTQVFTLLETLYRDFDEMAKLRGVYKVETIGDCYVAVTGLPDPRPDHVLAMLKFARGLLFRMRSLTTKLEITLGPDTGDLSLRIGVHTGPVTAGVLRTDRARFQLFGDTMNTASRMESTGERGRIHISQETAEVLMGEGKANLITLRKDKVVAKGKGELQTYWFESDAMTSSFSDQTSTAVDEEVVVFAEGGGNGATKSNKDNEPPLTQRLEELNNDSNVMSSERTKRLIDWHVDVLIRQLKKILASRVGGSLKRERSLKEQQLGKNRRNSLNRQRSLSMRQLPEGHTVISEVVDIIKLPEFNPKHFQTDKSIDAIKLSPAVVEQLRDYVTTVAAWYEDNAFHNFEHASHVTMSVVKLLSRIVAPLDNYCHDDASAKTRKGGKRTSLGLGLALHDHTYGITSCALTQFACVFSALIHDLDHAGVPNAQLVAEGARVAKLYRGKSCAEQNAVDLAWNLLMNENYGDLRDAIYANESQKRRFRQLVVNSVMATDIMDKDLIRLRNERWDKAFSRQQPSDDDDDDESETDAVNRKATIVIEHLLQASDVAHTMQHWEVYRKWNELLFLEMHEASEKNRSIYATHPAEWWYEGELDFFDNHVIPLAKKLEECGVFGVSSQEYLNYALQNRRLWEAHGQEVISEMLTRIIW